MDFYLGLLQIIGVHTLLGLSAYIVLLTGQVSLAQAGFFAIGAYVAGILTVLAGFHIIPAIFVGAIMAAIMACIVGFPALRVKGLMLVVATTAFGEFVRLFFFNFDYQREKNGELLGPLGGEGFRQIRFFSRKPLDYLRRCYLHLGHRHSGNGCIVVDGPIPGWDSFACCWGR